MASHHVYILRCADDTFYIGYTNNLVGRLRAHNGEVGVGARYTRGRRPVVLCYHEIFETRSEALKREHVLKQLTRAEKETLIKTQSN